MKLFGANYRNVRRAIFATTDVPAAIALVVIAVLGFFADHQNSLVAQQAARADMLAQASLIRSNLEGSIQLVRGLIATLSTEPAMDQQRFEQLAGNLFSGDNQLRNIAGAPNQEGFRSGLIPSIPTTPSKRSATLTRLSQTAGSIRPNTASCCPTGRLAIFVPEPS